MDRNIIEKLLSWLLNNTENIEKAQQVYNSKQISIQICILKTEWRLFGSGMNRINLI